MVHLYQIMPDWHQTRTWIIRNGGKLGEDRYSWTRTLLCLPISKSPTDQGERHGCQEPETNRGGMEATTDSRTISGCSKERN